MENVIDKLIGIDFSGCFSGCSRVCSLLTKLIPDMKIIEIGTNIGAQLREFVPNSSKTICIDVMYDWVPDIHPEMKFDPLLVSEKKIETWNSNVQDFRDKVSLLIESSYHIPQKYMGQLQNTNLLIIDGCHHPSENVFADFTNFRQFMTLPHYVIWDDIDMPDVNKASILAFDTLTNEGYKVVKTEIHNTRVFFVTR